MSSVKRFMLAGLFIVPVLLVQSAWAGIGFLPTSTHYQGSTSKAVSGMSGLVQVNFAVYDTYEGNEFADAGFAAPGDGQFTYVYQVYNDIEDDVFSIDIFRVFDIEPAAISGLDQISSEDDLVGGIETAGEYFSSSLTDGIWEFEEGTLMKNDHSWFLIISSDYDYISGDFSIYAPAPDDEFPVPGVPEPATMVLFGIGSAILAARRKNSVGISR